MLQKLHRVVLQKFPEEVPEGHPFHVGMNECDIYKISVGSQSSLETTATFVLLKEILPISRLPDNLFIIVYPIKLKLPGENDNTIPLYVTQLFMEHYSLTVGDLRLLKAVKCFPLEKIIVGSKTSRSYSFFQNLNLKKEVFADSRSHKLLFREGDNVLANLSDIDIDDKSMMCESVILDCTPFGQGIATTSTSVIVVDMSEICHHFESETRIDDHKRICKEKLEESAIFQDNSAYFHLMNYTSKLTLGAPIPVSVSKVTEAIPLMASTNSIKTRSFRFKIRIVPKFHREFIKEISNINDHFDPLSTIFVTKQALMKLGMRNTGWVKIKLLKVQQKKCEKLDTISVKNNDDGQDMQIEDGFFTSVSRTSKYNYRMAYMCCISDENVRHQYFESNKIVYLTPHLWFNLNQHPSKLVQPESRLQVELCNETQYPSYATEAHAPLIQSPRYHGSINTDKLLFEFFQTPRYVCKEDIICINSKGQIDFCLKEDLESCSSPVIYFRISSIEGKKPEAGYLIDNKHSRLYQTGSSNSYIPVTMEPFYSNCNNHPIWDSPTSEGLQFYVDTIQDLIFPFLNLKDKHHFSSNILLTGQPGCGKATVVKAVCKCLNLHLYEINCHQLAGESSATTEARLKILFDKGKLYAPCIILFKNIHFIGKEKEMNNEDSRVLHTFCQLLKSFNNERSLPIIVIGCTTDQKLLSNDIFSAFLHHVHMEAPSEEERTYLLQDLLSICIVGNDVSPVYIAQRTAGFVLGDLCALVEQAVRNAYKRLKKVLLESKANEIDEEDMILAGIPVVQRDLLNALEKLQSNFADAIGAPKIPNVLFEDIGGLADVKQEILDTIQLPLEHPEILFSGLRRSGLLLYGPPGTGKTLLAKAVATECSLNFLSVKGPELINMYVGQSEENVRAVFAEARSAVPCVIFFDELDSLAPNRGRSGDSGGVMDRVVSQLLAELDGLNKKTEVFVIGATNRPDLIDPALLRPGRFDRLLYVGIPEDKDSKICVLKALTQKFPLAEDVNLEEIAELCPPHLSGADLYSLCSNAVLKRVEKNVDLIENQNVDPKDISTDVHKEDFFDVLDSLVPSILPEQLIEYERIKLNF